MTHFKNGGRIKLNEYRSLCRSKMYISVGHKMLTHGGSNKITLLIYPLKNYEEQKYQKLNFDFTYLNSCRAEKIKEHFQNFFSP